MKEIVLFRHEAWIEAPHLINLLSKLGIPYRLIKIDEDDIIPSDLTNDIGGLVFLGGTMSVNDQLPWIEDELNLIRSAHEQKIPILGHCLGSQLISKALGGKVVPMKQKEIGWHPIHFMDNEVALDWQGKLPNNLEIMLWHGDEFTIPEGAYPLYTTLNCKNQAFVKDNILATVAHIELSTSMLQSWLDTYGYDIKPNQESVQCIVKIKENIESKIQAMHVLSDTFYLKWLKWVYPSHANPYMHNELQSYIKRGSCLCGDITFFLKHPRDVVNCHCEECRKFHGNYAAFTKVKRKNINIFGENKIRWYQLKQDQAKRGFCKKCGSSLFWQQNDNDGICVSASTLNIPTKLKTTKNIYTDYASDFYIMSDELEKYSSTMKDTKPSKKTIY